MTLPEKNHSTLQHAIERLPAYAPPDELWSGISGKLAEKPLQEAIRELPAYNPPEAIWPDIERALLEEIPAQPSLRRRPPSIRPIWVSIAAAVLLALLSLWWVMPVSGPSQPKVQMSYSREAAPPPFPAAVAEEEPAELQAILRAFEQRPFLQSQTDYERLRNDLEELSQARASLKEAIRRYGQDADLYRQVGQIERDRDRIIKQLAAAI